MKKFVVSLLATLLILTFTAATEKQNETGTPAKPQVLWKWGSDLEQVENVSTSTFEDCFIVPSKSGFYNCFDTTTGKLKWSFQKDGEGLKSPHKNGENFILPGSKTTACVDSSGKQLWKIELFYPVSMKLDQSRLFVFHSSPNSGSADTLSCLDSSDGHLIWRKQEVWYDSTSCSNIFNDRLYYSSNWGSSINCLNADNGSVLWKTDAGYDRILSSVLTIGGDYVLFTTKQRDHEVMGGFRFCSYDRAGYDTILVCLDAKTGIVRWSTDKVGSLYYPTIRIVGKNVYVVSGNYRTVLEASSGRIVFDIEDGDYDYSIDKNTDLTNIYNFDKDKLNVVDSSNGKITKSKIIDKLRKPRIFDLGDYIVLVTGGLNEVNDLICLRSSNLDILFQNKIFGRVDDIFLNNKKTILALIQNSSVNESKASKHVLGLSLSEANLQKKLGSRIWGISLSGFNFKPVITKDFVFAAIGTTIVCIGKNDGLTKWEYESDQYIETLPLVDHDSIFTNKNWNIIVSLDQTTGKQNWSYTGKNRLQLIQLLDNANLLIKGREDLYTMLDSENGKTLYILDKMNHSDAVFIDDNTICSYYAGNVTFADIETKTISQPWLLPPVERVFDSDANIDERVWAYWQGKLLVAVLDYDRNYQRNLICYDTNTFKELWSILIYDDISKEYNQVINGKMLLLKNKFLSLVSLEDGKAVWQIALDTQDPEQVSINPDYFYVKDNDKVACMSTETGKTMWEYEDKKVTTQTGSYQDELVLCSFGSMVFLKGNLPVKAATKPSSSLWKYLALALIVLMILAFLVIVLTKTNKIKH